MVQRRAKRPPQQEVGGGSGHSSQGGYTLLAAVSRPFCVAGGFWCVLTNLAHHVAHRAAAFLRSAWGRSAWGRSACLGAFLHCSANRANLIYNRIFRAFAHPEMHKVGAWGLRRPRALTMMFSLFWRRPPQKREKGDFVCFGCELRTREFVRSPPVEGGCAHRPPERESRGSCALIFALRCPWVERVR